TSSAPLRRSREAKNRPCRRAHGSPSIVERCTAVVGVHRCCVTTSPLTMPPQALVVLGRDVVVEFSATVPADGRLDLIELVEVRTNGHPALAAYLPDTSGECRGYGIMVLTLDGDRVATITGFPDPRPVPSVRLVGRALSA